MESKRSNLRRLVDAVLVGNRWRTFCGCSRVAYLEALTAALKDSNLTFEVNDRSPSSSEQFLYGSDAEGTRVTITDRSRPNSQSCPSPLIQLSARFSRLPSAETFANERPPASVWLMSRRSRTNTRTNWRPSCKQLWAASSVNRAISPTTHDSDLRSHSGTRFERSGGIGRDRIRLTDRHRPPTDRRGSLLECEMM